MKSWNRFALIAVLLLAACGRKETPQTPAPASPATENALAPALAQIDAADLMKHIKVLSSDEFEGRLPGTPGEEKTVAYISAQFKALGLAPGNPDGSFVQNVPLLGIDGKPTMSLSVNGKKIATEYRRDFVAATSRFVPEVKVENSDLVFVGYGVQAPEYGWDDYKGVDVHGKTLVMLINDPAIPDPKDPAKLDDAMFKGRAMTYYGRWTYKYEIASTLGAAAAIIIHETEPAAYPWAVVQNSWSGEQFNLASADKNMSRVPVQSWITSDKARELFKASGLDFDALKTAALSRDFKPVPLAKAKVSYTIENQLREVQSHNVIGKLDGSDDKLKSEYLIYTAHWDHLGRDTTLVGDQIYNGAADNASGVAGLLEIAQAFETLKVKPKRSVLFIAVTAEEQGLLGSKFYSENPLVPLDQTVATFNMDVLGSWGATRDTQIVGAGQNTLEDDYAAIVTRHGRIVIADAEPQKGSYFRSDQFNFAKQGVPSLYTKAGVDVIGKPGYGESKRAEYTANDYHKLSDEIKPDWDLSGAALDAQLLFEVGDVVANGDVWPTWKAGSEFKAKRDSTLKGSR
ncbi:MAG: putative aminopeptidase [Hydrocarboniphaga sp.]|uniref:M28 family metallopeptidase n=1 Tax=Hydrocarboniphaga sp. TaxID=2033016 RepID=UPI00262E26BE|nr:M28 family metallopeptidase [Hydrocarboniphaga sp.]MDB5968453.1 putative aminopeptidase [Hydrocarboniphaga sp.]